MFSCAEGLGNSSNYHRVECETIKGGCQGESNAGCTHRPRCTSESAECRCRLSQPWIKTGIISTGSIFDAADERKYASYQCRVSVAVYEHRYRLRVSYNSKRARARVCCVYSRVYKANNGATTSKSVISAFEQIFRETRVFPFVPDFYKRHVFLLLSYSFAANVHVNYNGDNKAPGTQTHRARNSPFFLRIR